MELDQDVSREALQFFSRHPCLLLQSGLDGISVFELLGYQIQQVLHSSAWAVFLSQCSPACLEPLASEVLSFDIPLRDDLQQSDIFTGGATCRNLAECSPGPPAGGVPKCYFE